VRVTILLISAIFFLATPSRGQTQSAPATPQPRSEDTLSKTVVRITATAEGVVGPLNATGFLVGIPDKRFTIPNGLFTYVVTNRHVAEAMLPDANGHPARHKILTMNATINLKDSINGSRVHSIPLPPAGVTWVFPEDNAIDLAVISIPLDNSYDVVAVTPDNFLTPDLWEKDRIGPGDKVLTCGYFLHYAGAHRFQPIIREGSLAMVPDDKMPGTIGGEAKVYLADIHIIPGNSGSPLFLAPAFTLGGYVTDDKGGIPYFVFGVVSGYMWEDNELTLRAATDYEGAIHANSGIAMIVPIIQLKDLLYSPTLKQARDSLFTNQSKPQ
jgi:hypothetical protein